MPQKVERWLTKDGKIFNTEQEAVKSEALTTAREYLRALIERHMLTHNLKEDVFFNLLKVPNEFAIILTKLGELSK